MKKIITTRAGGKTNKLVSECLETGYTIVCSSNSIDYIYHLLRQVCEGEPKDIPVPISYDTFIRGGKPIKNVKGFLIDNVDVFMTYLAKEKPVGAITLTIDN